MQLTAISYLLMVPTVSSEKDLHESLADKLLQDNGTQVAPAARLDPATVMKLTASVGITAIRCAQTVHAAHPYHVSLLVAQPRCFFFGGGATCAVLLPAGSAWLSACMPACVSSAGECRRLTAPSPPLPNAALSAGAPPPRPLCVLGLEGGQRVHVR